MRQKVFSDCWIAGVLEVVVAAGMSILRAADDRFEPAYSVMQKSDCSPVTQADLASNQTLCRGLLSIDPTIQIISEEGSEFRGEDAQRQKYWLIDPLDGTREFIAGSGEFTVNAAFVSEGRAVWGAVFAPAIDHLYWGGEAFGAFRCVGGNVDRIGVQSPVDRSRVRLITTKSHMNEQTKIFIKRFHGCNLVEMGSSLKICRLAEGAADLYPRLGQTYEWDTAAGQAVLEGAGGSVTDMDGHRILYGKPSLKNPHFVAASSAEWSKWMTLAR